MEPESECCPSRLAVEKRASVACPISAEAGNFGGDPVVSVAAHGAANNHHADNFVMQFSAYAEQMANNRRVVTVQRFDERVRFREADPRMG